MDRRCLFILIATVLYVNDIQCDDQSKHRPIDFLKPTNDENGKRDMITTTTSKTNGDEVTDGTPKPSDDEPISGIKKFIDDVKNKFNHIHPVRDVKEILFGTSEKATNLTAGNTTPMPSTTTQAVKKSHIDQIVESMPSESEDMIRVVTLKPDEHYGKGRAKPKYLTLELEKQNSTEYDERSTTTTTTTSKTTTTGQSSIEDFSTSITTHKTMPKDSIRK